MKYVILGHENPDVDSLVSGYLLEKIMKKMGYDVSFCVPDKELSLESEKICTKYKLNPRKYMVDNLEEDAKYILRNKEKEEFKRILEYTNNSYSSAALSID